MNISLDSPSGKEQPAALQWELTIPADQLTLIDGNPQPGPEAKAAGKSIACRVKTKEGDAQTSICIVFGGRDPIHNGVIAILQSKIAAGSKPASARIRIDHALAVTNDLKRSSMPAAEGVVTIRQK